MNNNNKKYRILWVRGSYRLRQKLANKNNASGYIEHHFNASNNNNADYSLVIVGTNASSQSHKWARNYLTQLDKCTGIETKLHNNCGVIEGGFNLRGNSNIFYTKMPAILLEPLFCSNVEHAKYLKSSEGQKDLARALMKSIVTLWPAGGLFAFSVGHKYKSSKSNDRGALCHGGGFEADYAEAVLEKCESMLLNI